MREKTIACPPKLCNLSRQQSLHTSHVPPSLSPSVKSCPPIFSETYPPLPLEDPMNFPLTPLTPFPHSRDRFTPSTGELPEDSNVHETFQSLLFPPCSYLGYRPVSSCLACWPAATTTTPACQPTCHLLPAATCLRCWPCEIDCCLHCDN